MLKALNLSDQHIHMGAASIKPLADRSIAWIIGIPIMPYQSIEIKPGSMIYPLNPFGNLYALALVDPSRLFLQSQQTDSHVFSNARKRLPEGITINTTDQSSQKLGAASSLPSGHHPFHHFTSMILPAKSPLPEGPRPKAVLWFTHTPLTISYFPTVSPEFSVGLLYFPIVSHQFSYYPRILHFFLSGKIPYYPHDFQ